VTLSCPVGGCAIVSALYGHVGSLECGVVRRRRPSINGKALHLRVAQIPSDECERFIELSFRRPVSPDHDGLGMTEDLCNQARCRMFSRSVRATRTEARQPLPGDDIISKPVGSLTHAVTITRPPHDVWPWLAQMGAGSRAGWYSYDFLDNARQPSARRIVSELQSLTAGMVFPAVPGATDGFTLLAFEPERFLVLGWLSPDRSPLVTWAFVLQELAGGTRLIVRARGGPAYAFHGLPPWISQRVIRVVHFVMQRKQLIGIADRAERSATFAAISGQPGTQKGLAPDRVTRPHLRTIALWTAVGAGLIAGAYGAYVALTWARYGRVRPPRREAEVTGAQAARRARSSVTTDGIPIP
jgi:hypothetical protein